MSLKDLIKSINDRTLLKALLRFAIRASNLAEFETKYLNQSQ